MTIISPDTISFTARISEDELRERMIQEVCEAIGALDDDGKPLKTIKSRVTRGTGRAGGYTVEVTGPAPTRLALTHSTKQES